MCPRSPGVHCAALAGAIAGTQAEQLIVGVDAGAMPIAPLDPQTICTHQRDGDRANVGPHSAGFEQRPTGHLFDAAGAGARQPKLAGRKERLMSRGLPVDQKSIVPAGDAVGGWGGHWLLAIGYWLLAIGYWAQLKIR